jgi:2-oxoglutarate dehydrogenase E1 component
VYYSLAAAREKENVRGTALVRVEQLYPFPRKEIQAVLARYRQAREICWVQEEPENRGAWSFMQHRLRELLPDPAVLTYFGRDEAASPATGNYKMHQVEEQEIIAHALEIAAKEKTAAKGEAAAAGAGNAPQAAATSAPAAAGAQTPVSD